MYTDPFGLCERGTKEPTCKTKDEAARKAMQKIYKRSVNEDREYGGEIVEARNGKGYVYTHGRADREAAFTPNLNIKGYAGAYHSHGANNPKYDNEVFSGCKAPDSCDKSVGDEFKQPIYLVTPSGKMLRYDPDPTGQQGGPTTAIGQVVP